MIDLPKDLSSGANHVRVAERNPDWSVMDWCRYWELDARKIERKYGIKWDRLQDCGDGCSCACLK